MLQGIFLSSPANLFDGTSKYELLLVLLDKCFLRVLVAYTLQPVILIRDLMFITKNMGPDWPMINNELTSKQCTCSGPPTSGVNEPNCSARANNTSSSS